MRLMYSIKQLYTGCFLHIFDRFRAWHGTSLCRTNKQDHKTESPEIFVLGKVARFRDISKQKEQKK